MKPLNFLLAIIFLLTIPAISFAQTQLGMDVDGEAAGDSSGAAVALSSDGLILAIGATRNDGNGPSSGHVRVYEWQHLTNSWDQLGSDIDGESAGDWSGSAVSLSADGTRVAIAAQNNDDAAYSAGQVRVYELIEGSWWQVGADIDGQSEYNYLGSSVSLSNDGNRLAIGAHRDNYFLAERAGSVSVYEFVAGEWVQLGLELNGYKTADYFGYSVSLNADGYRVAIGATGSNGNGNSSGHVAVYEWDGMSWIQLGSDIEGIAVANGTGYSVSLSMDGSRVAFGAPGNDANGVDSGLVRVFEFYRGEWRQLGFNIYGESETDRFGSSLSISSDGNLLAIGAYQNDFIGLNSGSVKLFQLRGDEWTQLGSDIYGESAGDALGISVSISADGLRLAIGANGNDDAATNAGQVRVFDLDFLFGSSFD